MPVITAQQAGGENLLKFLDLIAHSEGTSNHPLTKNDGYDVLVTGIDGPEVFSDYADHPFAARQPNIIRRVPLLRSTAAGRYQLLLRYWPAYREQLGLPDFSPLSQDEVALRQIRERGAYGPIQAGNIALGIHLCSNIWASFPGNNYGQNPHSMDALLSHFSTQEVQNARA